MNPSAKEALLNECRVCHLLHDDITRKFTETFSSFEYYNIGIPINTEVRALNGATEDIGFLSNPNINDNADKGKHKVPSLRNVAVTEPYMHNGIFRDLKTAAKFYDHFINPGVRLNNPETGAPWKAPEIPDNMSSKVLAAGHAMTDAQIEAMVCFFANTDR